MSIYTHIYGQCGYIYIYINHLTNRSLTEVRARRLIIRTRVAVARLPSSQTLVKMRPGSAHVQILLVKLMYFPDYCYSAAEMYQLIGPNLTLFSSQPCSPTCPSPCPPACPALLPALFPALFLPCPAPCPLPCPLPYPPPCPPLPAFLPALLPALLLALLPVPN